MLGVLICNKLLEENLFLEWGYHPVVSDEQDGEMKKLTRLCLKLISQGHFPITKIPSTLKYKHVPSHVQKPIT